MSTSLSKKIALEFAFGLNNGKDGKIPVLLEIKLAFSNYYRVDFEKI